MHARAFLETAVYTYFRNHEQFAYLGITQRFRAWPPAVSPGAPRATRHAKSRYQTPTWETMTITGRPLLGQRFCHREGGRWLLRHDVCPSKSDRPRLSSKLSMAPGLSEFWRTGVYRLRRPMRRHSDRYHLNTIHLGFDQVCWRPTDRRCIVAASMDDSLLSSHPS